MFSARKRYNKRKKKSLFTEIVKNDSSRCGVGDDGLIVLFSGHVLSERARMARTQVRRIALTYVIELLMERCAISSDGKDFLVITTNF